MSRLENEFAFPAEQFKGPYLEDDEAFADIQAAAVRASGLGNGKTVSRAAGAAGSTQTSDRHPLLLPHFLALHPSSFLTPIIVFIVNNIS